MSGRSGWLRPEGALAIVAPPTVWAMHFVAVYALSGVACAPPGDVRLPSLEPGWLLPSLVGTTALALGLVALLAQRARRAMREPAGDDDVVDPGPRESASRARRRFLAWVAAGSALVAAIAIALSAMMILMLPACVER